MGVVHANYRVPQKSCLQWVGGLFAELADLGVRGALGGTDPPLSGRESSLATSGLQEPVVGHLSRDGVWLVLGVRLSGQEAENPGLLGSGSVVRLAHRWQHPGAARDLT